MLIILNNIKYYLILNMGNGRSRMEIQYECPYNKLHELSIGYFIKNSSNHLTLSNSYEGSEFNIEKVQTGSIENIGSPFIHNNDIIRLKVGTKYLSKEANGKYTFKNSAVDAIEFIIQQA